MRLEKNIKGEYYGKYFIYIYLLLTYYSSFTEYKKYDTTTQIVALPGGEKRDKNSIKADVKLNKKNNTSYYYKMLRDYNSDLIKDEKKQKVKIYSNLFIQNFINFKLNITSYPAQQRFGKYFGRYNQSSKDIKLINQNNKNEFQVFGKPSDYSKNSIQNSSSKKSEVIAKYFKSQIVLG